MFKVVILSANAANLVPCVRAVLTHEPALPPEHIIVVDDGARPKAEPHLPGLTWVAGAKPFVFSRNANLGITAAASDVILLNDDALLLTAGGFTRLIEQAQTTANVGVCSAAVQGLVGNPRQLRVLPTNPRPANGVRFEPQHLAFVSVFLPWAVYQHVGPLDERFIGYGFDDNDYCERVKAAGYRLGIWDGCVVDHSGKLPSTYRTRRDLPELYHANRLRYQAKLRQPQAPPVRPARLTQQAQPVQQAQIAQPTQQAQLPQQAQLAGSDGLRTVDLLYLAWNRLEFTQETFTTLLANTDWQYVRELVVCDDGSQDGACEWLAGQLGRVPASARLVKTRFGSPVAAMNHWIEQAAGPMLAKTDNDAMLPPGWLRQSLAVMERHPELSMLGIEAMYPVNPDPTAARTYTPAQFVSGLGLYRREVFSRSRPKVINRYFGLEEWQQGQRSRLRVGWITPALPVFLLDRMPYDPWRGYADSYTRRGWQRAWPAYDPANTLWHWRWPELKPAAKPVAVAAAAPALAGPRLNIAHLADAAAADGVDGDTHVALLPGAGGQAVDLTGAWPWPDDAFAEVRAFDIVEHLLDKINTLNELWRVTRPGGVVELRVPTTDGPGAWADPTHVSFWNRRSFLYCEAGNPYRERFARSYGIKAQFQVLQERVEATTDGPVLTIALQSVKAAEKVAPAAEKQLPDGDARFVAALRIKNEAAHIGEVLERALALCGRAYVFDDHSTDETAALCRAFGARVALLPSPFEGLDEARDKNYLLQQVIAARPEWVLWIDGDEVLEAGGPAQLKAAVQRAQGVAAFSLKIAYLWDDPEHVRVDGIFGRFTRPSLFRLQGQPVGQLAFPTTGYGGNFHCGNIPQGLVGRTVELGVRLKHYGYMARAQRDAKYKFYTTIDPNNAAEDNYRHLAGEPGARYAPGAPVIVGWVE